MSAAEIIAELPRLTPAELAEVQAKLAELARSKSALDVSDEWGDDDLSELTAYSAQHAEQRNRDAGSQR